MNIVLGGQAGSEAKGKLSAFLCDNYPVDMIVMTASPNAGHTVIMPNGDKKVSYHLPIGSVMCDCPIVLTAASLLNLETFAAEIVALGIDPRRIIVDPRAAIIVPGDIAREHAAGLSDIGSTLQGIGETRMGKMTRVEGFVTFAAVARHFCEETGVQLSMIPTSKIINYALDRGTTVLCEMTQGFDLDLEHGIHPRYCTSKMINPSMAMAEAGVSPRRVGEIYAVIRPFPIRVNNRTGTSGPYAEAQEITWEKVAESCGHPSSLPFEPGGTVHEPLAEITTTTKLPRRVFEFSWERFHHMIQVCAPTSICLQFANYVDWEVYEAKGNWDNLTYLVQEFILTLKHESGVPVEFVGTGPGHDHMIHLHRGLRREG